MLCPASCQLRTQVPLHVHASQAQAGRPLLSPQLRFGNAATMSRQVASLRKFGAPRPCVCEQVPCFVCKLTTNL